MQTTIKTKTHNAWYLTCNFQKINDNNNLIYVSLLLTPASTETCPNYLNLFSHLIFYRCYPYHRYSVLTPSCKSYHTFISTFSVQLHLWFLLAYCFLLACSYSTTVEFSFNFVSLWVSCDHTTLPNTPQALHHLTPPKCSYRSSTKIDSIGRLIPQKSKQSHTQKSRGVKRASWHWHGFRQVRQGFRRAKHGTAQQRDLDTLSTAQHNTGTKGHGQGAWHNKY